MIHDSGEQHKMDLVEIVREFDPDFLKNSTADILMHGSEMEENAKLARLAKELIPDIGSLPFLELANAGSRLKEVKAAVDKIEFQLRMHSPSQFIDAAAKGESEIAAAYQRLDYTNGQSAYNFGQSLGKYVRNVRSLQEQCDTSIAEISSLLSALPNDVDSVVVKNKIDEVKSRGNETIESFRNAKKELSKKEQSALDIVNSMEKMFGG